MSLDKTSKHIEWIDLLRIVACFLVVLSHAGDPFVGRFDRNYGEFLTGALVGSFVRSCVPLFVMISSVLLLPTNLDMGSFYAKRAKRLLLPFVFWSLALPLLYFVYMNSGIQPIVNPNVDMNNYTIEKTVEKLYTFFLNFNYDTTPLWYIFMLIGLYLFMPIISAWLRVATKKDLHYFLVIWLISLCLPYLQMLAPLVGYSGNYGNMGLLGICDWNSYGMLYYFSGFLGYAVLAHYLTRFGLNWSWLKTLWVTIPLFMLGYAITAGGFILTQEFYPGSYAELEVIWYFSGINVCLMTVSVFVIAQKIKIKPLPIVKKMASLTFGIYLLHFFIVQVVYDWVYPNLDIPAFFQLVLIAVISFLLSLLIVWLMSLNRWTQRVVI